jgi:hypothetical protein
MSYIPSLAGFAVAGGGGITIFLTGDNNDANANGDVNEGSRHGRGN